MSTATDGALDMTYALLVADKQWGGPAHGRTNANSGAVPEDSEYLYWGKGAVHQLRMTNVNRGFPTTTAPLFNLTIGNWAGGNNRRITRPSDFMLTHMKTYRDVGHKDDWNRVLDATYRAIDEVRHPATGLLPDFLWYGADNLWRPLGVSPSDGLTHWNERTNGTDARYGPNACRVPWRLALDVLHDGANSPVYDTVQAMNQSMRDRANGSWENIRGGQLDGTFSGTSGSLMFQGPYLVTAAAFGPQEWMTNGWNWARARRDSPDNYGDYIQILSMIAASGNWWDPTVAGTDPIVRVGAQNGVLNREEAGTVTFPVTVTNIGDGTYDAEVANLPAGITAVSTEVEITDGTGTLTLAGGTSTIGGVYRTLALRLIRDEVDVTSSPFTLTIAVPSAAVGAQTGELRAGETGMITFPVFTTLIGDGTYDITLDGLPGSITAPETLTITGGSGTLEISGSLALPDTRTLILTIMTGSETAVSMPFTLTITPGPGSENYAVGFVYMFTNPTTSWAFGYNNASSPKVEFDVTLDDDHVLTLNWQDGGDGILSNHRDIYLLQPTQAANPDRKPVTIHSVKVNGGHVHGPMNTHASAPGRWLVDSTLGTMNPVTTVGANANAQGTAFSDAGLELRTFYLPASNAAGGFTIPANAKVEITFRVGEGPTPVITTQPASQTVAVGGSATFTVEAESETAQTFQWQVSADGNVWTDIPGAASGTLRVDRAEQGVRHYRCIVTNIAGSTESNPVTLTAVVPNYGDVDGDGNINAADVTLLRRYIAAEDKKAFLETNTFHPLNAKVVDEDAPIGAQDITLLRRWLASPEGSKPVLGPRPADITLTLRPAPGTPKLLGPGEQFSMEIHIDNPGEKPITSITNLNLTFDSELLAWDLPNPGLPYSDGGNWPFFPGIDQDYLFFVPPAQIFDNAEDSERKVNAHFVFDSREIPFSGSEGLLLTIDFRVKSGATAPIGAHSFALSLTDHAGVAAGITTLDGVLLTAGLITGWQL
jgi:hypothetical protein